MRIIAGVHGGRRLVAPPGLTTRPTADRVKEAIFSVLTPHLANARVLDLFSGSGALALEALSRGAREAVLVEPEHHALAAIQRNVALCNMTAQARVIKGQAAAVLSGLQESFDLIFLDPPYHRGHIEKVEPFLVGGTILAPGGIVILETGAKEQEGFCDPRWNLWKTASYGDTAVLYYRL